MRLVKGSISEDLLVQVKINLEVNSNASFLIQVAEFTLADGQSSTSTSLLRSLCHSDDSVILGTRFQDAEEAAIEDQLLANSASGSGALEHDLCSLFRPMPRGKEDEAFRCLPSSWTTELRKHFENAALNISFFL